MSVLEKLRLLLMGFTAFDFLLRCGRVSSGRKTSDGSS